MLPPKTATLNFPPCFSQALPGEVGFTTAQVDYAFEILDEHEDDRELRVLAFELEEAVGQGFELRIELHAHLDDLGSPTPGQSFRFAIRRDGLERQICGLVEELVDLRAAEGEAWRGLLRGRATLQCLDAHRRFRIWQQTDIHNLLDELIGGSLGTRNRSLDHSGIELGKEVRPYCVQYGESDYDFARRLWSEHYLNFRIECDPGDREERVVLYDRGDAFPDHVEDQQIIVEDASHADDLDFHGPGRVLRFRVHERNCAQELRISTTEVDNSHQTLEDHSDEGCSGNPETPRIELLHHAKAGFKHDEPGSALAENTAELALARARSRRLRGLGEGGRFTLQAGQRLALLRSDSREESEWLTVRVQHSGGDWSHLNSSEGVEERWPGLAQLVHQEQQHSGRQPKHNRGVGLNVYVNRFESIPYGEMPELPDLASRPVPGPQLALVVSRDDDHDHCSCEEVDVDELGRIRVRFPWSQGHDTPGSHTAHSCWVRVAQPWMGFGWGTQFLPRVGTQVLVSFLGHDPDCPVVVGGMLPQGIDQPFPCPSGKTRSGIKTLSNPGGEGYNELSFEDEKDKEQVHLHAQRELDVNVRQHEIRKVGGQRTTTIGSHDIQTIKDTRAAKVFGRCTELFCSDYEMAVEAATSTSHFGAAVHSYHTNLSVQVCPANSNKGELCSEEAAHADMTAPGELESEEGLYKLDVQGRTLWNISDMHSVFVGPALSIHADATKAEITISGGMNSITISEKGEIRISAATKVDVVSNATINLSAPTINLN